MKKLKNFIKKLFSHEEIQEVKSTQNLSNIINQGVYLPITTSSLRINSLQYILNDIVINQRTSLLELGSGISTIAIARLIKLNKISAQLISVDENAEWLNIIRRTLVEENLMDAVTLIHAPLNDKTISIKNTNWYSTSVVNKAIEQKTFDLVLVDAPSAYRPEIQFARYPAFPFLKDKLKPNFSFFLDDTNRHGEQEIIKMWENQFNVKFTNLNSSFAYATAGQAFNIH